MIIAIPEKFFYTAETFGKAFVENNILYIEGRINFESLMYTITYSLRGYTQCLYCGRELLANRRTLDHMYPRCFGGVSIPNNLLPCCPSCNRTKSCLTYSQFVHLRRIQSKSKRERVFNRMVERNNCKYKNGFILPREWVSYYDITQALSQIKFDDVSQDKVVNEKIEMFYFKYKHYSKPIVVTANGWVFDGLHILYHAQKHGITNVPAIILDNVIHLPY